MRNNQPTEPMKQWMMALALVILTAGAHAQESGKPRERKDPAERAKARTEHMVKELGLSAEQATRLEALNLKYAEENEVKRAETEQDRETRRAEMKARHAGYEADLQSLLTPEQFAAWTKKKEERKAKHMDKRKEMREQRKTQPVKPE